MKNSNDTIGNRTRDLPACSAVPQPTAPQRAPFLFHAFRKNKEELCLNEALFHLSQAGIGTGKERQSG